MNELVSPKKKSLEDSWELLHFRFMGTKLQLIFITCTIMSKKRQSFFVKESMIKWKIFAIFIFELVHIYAYLYAQYLQEAERPDMNNSLSCTFAEFAVKISEEGKRP